MLLCTILFNRISMLYHTSFTQHSTQLNCDTTAIQSMSHHKYLHCSKVKRMGRRMAEKLNRGNKGSEPNSTLEMNEATALNNKKLLNANKSYFENSVRTEPVMQENKATFQEGIWQQIVSSNSKVKSGLVLPCACSRFCRVNFCKRLPKMGGCLTTHSFSKLN